MDTHEPRLQLLTWSLSRGGRAPQREDRAKELDPGPRPCQYGRRRSAGDWRRAVPDPNGTGNDPLGPALPLLRSEHGGNPGGAAARGGTAAPPPPSAHAAMLVVLLAIAGVVVAALAGAAYSTIRLRGR